MHYFQSLRLCKGRTTHRGSRGLALFFHDHGTRRGWGVSVTPRQHFTPEKTRYPLYRRLGGPQGRSGQVRKISSPPGFDPRTVQPIASRYTDWATRPTTRNKLSVNSRLFADLWIFNNVWEKVILWDSLETGRITNIMCQDTFRLSPARLPV